MTITERRPQPLQDVVTSVTTTHGVPMGALTALVTAGVISANTGSLITALYGLVPGVLAVAATVLGANRVAVVGEPLVTPISDPVTNTGQRLIPEPLNPVTPPINIPAGVNIPPITTTSSGGTFGPPLDH